tara:strand:+ start:470 stop:661 length:192 start_codon:yes stop_codon:yes gene_type:complete
MMQKLITIINKVKEIDMDKIKEIEDYFKIIDKLIDLTNEKNKSYLEIKILMDDYRKNYVNNKS